MTTEAKKLNLAKLMYNIKEYCTEHDNNLARQMKNRLGDITEWDISKDTLTQLKKDYNSILDFEKVTITFQNKYQSLSLPDKQLKTENKPTRDLLPMVLESNYGVIYLRDDAVQILFDRIKELEKERQKL